MLLGVRSDSANLLGGCSFFWGFPTVVGALPVSRSYTNEQKGLLAVESAALLT